MHQQSALFHFTDRLYRARNLDQIYSAALDAIADMLGCTRASILQFDDKGVLRFAAWRRLSEEYRRGVEGHSPWQPGHEEPAPVYLGDIGHADLPSDLAALIRLEGIGALAFIPVMVSQGMAGKFTLYYEGPHLFTNEERELALIIARQLGFAIERHHSDQTARRFTALVESSDDAIISKNLEGIIISWNAGAERLFGYGAPEAIGRSVMMLIPPDRHNEEPAILARIRAGERIDHYETIRRRKDGGLVDISLSVSPIKNAEGVIIGASKIARDITERRRAQEQQQLLLHEMDHRVKNLFALATSIVNLSVASAETPAALASIVADRLGALSRAHALTLASRTVGNGFRKTATLHALIEAILAPYVEGAEGERKRFTVEGIDIELAESTVTPVALLLHEFATNAAKYGSFSTSGGRVEIECRRRGGDVVLVWRELGGPTVQPSDTEGFGSRLVRLAASQFGGFSRQWHPEGLVIELTMDISRVGA
ncbi:PAS domain S-box protein [Labrys sp. KNU-23]|uniref:PAS domain S-box protein n=1 Tax=Labrys sp. KNU-23 TaxID=2789216 RepID=UPI0011EE80A8|nr:PAS domain S-box protein [Labrys sp. KNU-23]QEN85272.1 PAS domain S-box protein [Labrys sp. KNU-23]